MPQSFQDKKQVTLKVLEQIAKLAGSRNSQEITGQLQQEMEHLRSGELNVVVCGECKRGKSSLLNAFLEEPGLCPVDAPVATNAITMIRYGETERIVVHYQDESGKTAMEETSRDRLREYVTEQGNARNQRRVQLVQIWLPNPRLKDGLVLIDTPGVGSLNVEHTAVTYGIIPYADAVLFVGAATEPLSVPELEFCERIARHSPHFLHVLTKRDCVENFAEILQHNLEKLSSILKREVKGVAVSSKMKMEYVESGDQEDLELSGFPDLERAMWDLLAQRGDILLARATGRALPAISEMRMPLETEQQALSATSAAELQEIDDRIQAKLKRLEELGSESAFWVNELNHRMAVLRNECGKWVADEFAEIQRLLVGYLKVESYLHDPKKLGNMLTVDTNNAFAMVARRLETSLGAVVSDLREMTKLGDISGGAADVSGPVALHLEPDEQRRDSFLTRGSGVGRSCTIHSMGLGTAGALVGGILGGIIGTIAAPGAGTIVGAQLGASVAGGISALVGGIFGIQKAIADQAQKDLAGLRQNLGAACRDQLAAAQRTVSHELNLLLTNAQSEIHKSLMREIQREQKACKESSATLAKARQKRQVDFADRLRELNNILKHLENLAKTLTGMTDAPAAATANAAV